MVDQRTKPFTKDENDILVELYSKHREAFQTNCMIPNYTERNSIRKKLWTEIQDAVNAVGGNCRTIKQVQNKIHGMRNLAKWHSISTTANNSNKDTAIGYAKALEHSVTNHQLESTFPIIDVRGPRNNNFGDYNGNDKSISAAGSSDADATVVDTQLTNLDQSQFSVHDYNRVHAIFEAEPISESQPPSAGVLEFGENHEKLIKTQLGLLSQQLVSLNRIENLLQDVKQIETEKIGLKRQKLDLLNGYYGAKKFKRDKRASDEVE